MRDILNNIVESRNVIHAAFLIDQDGLSIEEVGLSATLGADCASSVSSSAVSFFHSSLDSAIGDINFIVSETERFTLALVRINGIAILGILSHSLF